jgi:hypothetical protein
MPGLAFGWLSREVLCNTHSARDSAVTRAIKLTRPRRPARATWQSLTAEYVARKRSKKGDRAMGARSGAT